MVTIAELARQCGQSYMTTKNQMVRGWCAWPRIQMDGTTKNPAYKCWENMVQRCTNPNATGNYFGMELYPEWRVSFRSFLSYIGERPSKGHSIDRIDNTKGYLPGNVRWATAKEQWANSNHKPPPPKIRRW